MNNSDASQPLWSVGLMTGTVLDGNIDVALLKSDGEKIIEFGPYILAPYDSALLALLGETVDQARCWQFQGPRPAIFADAEQQLTRAQTAAVQGLLDSAGITADEVEIIGFHGQTVLHRPPEQGQLGRTCQLGDGQLMSDQLGIPVAFDFRSNDMALGGQGAPLAAIYHAALLEKSGCSAEDAMLNLGGVANLTWWDAKNTLIAFDTGPANAPINDFIKQHGLGDMDRDGLLAASGVVDEKTLNSLLEHSYLYASYPKSLDRFSFTAAMAEGLSAENGAALLTAFSAAAVGKALDLLPQRPQRLIASGGGRHNPSLMQAIKKYAKVDVLSADVLGLRGDAIEAECFAFLARRVLRGLPLSFPSTTGVSRAVCGGQLVHPKVAIR